MSSNDGNAQTRILVGILYDIWSTLIIGSVFGLLSNVFVADAFALSQLTVYSTIINLMARTRIVDANGVRASGAIVGVLMCLVFWCVTWAYGYEGLFGEVEPNAFGNIVLHLIVPLDAAVAARNAFRGSTYLDVVYTIFFSAGYSILFVASTPYPFTTRISAWSRTGISVGCGTVAVASHAGLIRWTS